MLYSISNIIKYFSSIQSPISSYQTTTDGFMKSSVYGIPIFTYTLIAITTLTLAYVTLADDNDSSYISSSRSEPAFKMPDLIPDALKPESFKQDGGKKNKTKHGANNDPKSKKTHKRR